MRGRALRSSRTSCESRSGGNRICLSHPPWRPESSRGPSSRRRSCRRRFKKILLMYTENTHLGSGCGSVGRVIAFDTRGPRFESSHFQTFLLSIVNCVEKTKIKKKDSHLNKDRYRLLDLQRLYIDT